MRRPGFVKLFLKSMVTRKGGCLPLCGNGCISTASRVARRELPIRRSSALCERRKEVLRK